MSIAISFDHVGKLYQLGVVGTGTLSHDLNRWWATKILRKEDPYLKIGETNDRSKKGSSDFVWALRDITFDVEQGDVVGIIGKNGAGKSTLLKLLSRITSPSTGVIRARGRIGSLLEVGTGFHPEMTGRENIYMNGSIMGMTRAEITRKLDEIVDFAGVERYLDTPVKRYSSGMTVRLGFAVAAFMEPEILVVDEVLAVGDAEFQKKAIGKMQDVSKGEGRTVLFVSHNMKSVKQLCNRGILLKDGTVDYIGTVNDVVDKYLAAYQAEGLCSYASFGIDSSKTHQIIEAKLTNSKGCLLQNAIKATDDIYLHIRYRFSKSIENLHLVVGILNMSEEYVYFQDRSDYYKNYAKVEEGIYESVIKIPNPLLNEGVYMISLGCTDVQSNINNNAPFVLKFEISDVSSFRKVRRPGYIFYPLPWELKKI